MKILPTFHKLLFFKTMTYIPWAQTFEKTF